MIKNAGMVGRSSVCFPHSKLKEAICTCLLRESYIKDFSKKIKNNHPSLEVELFFTEGKTPKISQVERISKQSRRVYFGVKDIFPVKNGKGLLVLSTPKGILSGKNARKEQVGGEALFRLW